MSTNPQSKEITEWRFQASGLEAEQRAIEEIITRKNKLEADSVNFIEKLKTRLAPTLLPLEPGKFVIVKPSKRQGATRAGYMGLGNIVFWNAEKTHIPLKEHEDYKVWDTRNPWKGDEFKGENEAFFLEILEEIDEQKT